MSPSIVYKAPSQVIWKRSSGDTKPRRRPSTYDFGRKPRPAAEPEEPRYILLALFTDDLSDLPVQLFLKRHQTAHQFPLLQKHIPMLEELGPDGMSSDESDRGDKELTRYRIHSPAWRADAVGSWLRTFDTISTIFRRETGAGANPRIRNPTQRKSDRKEFVPGLPINVYDPSWLERDARRKYDLYPAQETYDFTHAPRIIEWVPRISFVRLLIQLFLL